MQRFIIVLLLLCSLLATTACQQEQSALIADVKEPIAQSEDGDEPYDTDRPDEPIEAEQGEEISFPGLPIYVETEAHRAMEQAAIDDPNGEPQPASPDSPTVFDHFDDPPPDGAIRLVYVYNYGETETLLLEDDAETDKILSIVDSFELSDYTGGPMMGGYMVQIQVVRDGIHQCYSVLSMDYDGRYIAVNGREAENWYVTHQENFELLMDFFGGMPQ